MDFRLISIRRPESVPHYSPCRGAIKNASRWGWHGTGRLSRLLLCWLDRDTQTNSFARIIGHDARVVAAAVVVSNLIAIVARFPMVDLAALLDGLFLHAALVVVL